MSEKIILNAENQILGRMASRISKKLQEGEEIELINSEKAVITGDPDATLKKYKEKKDRGDRDKGPFFPEASDRIIKRAVKGMLPKNKKGKKALKRFRAHIGDPDLDGESEKLENCGIDTLSDRGKKFITLKEISEFIGS